ncbi:tetratricopeptide repeat protein [Nocardia testacea]|uniref:tetratricopeptide repeat protein n=1 Tax=Nocardia testacea TaxID=248551 RepID=UPI003A874F20
MPIVVNAGVNVGGDFTTNYYYSNDPVTRSARLVDLVERFGGQGGLPMIAELDPYLLSATPSQFGEAGRSGSDDPYVSRTHNDVDRRLADKLMGDRLVLVIGPSKAGKTRSLFEAVRARLPDARILVPTPESLAQVPTCPDFVSNGDTIVVWLENLDRFFITRKPLTLQLLSQISSTRAARTVVVATLRSGALKLLKNSGEDLDYDIRAVLEQANRIDLAPTSENSQEQSAAAKAYPSLKLGKYGLGEILADAPELLRHYDDSRYDDPVLYTIVQIAVDWARVGHPDPIPESTLANLTMTTIEHQHPELEISSNEVRAAIATARKSPLGIGRVAPLIAERLPDRSRGYRPFDYLVAADDGERRSPRPIPGDFWTLATENADVNILISIGITARLRGYVTAAENILRGPADAGDFRAMAAFGGLLWERGEAAMAEFMLRRAAVGGEVNAQTLLAPLLMKRGQDAEAEKWASAAADAGRPVAMVTFGILLSKRGEAADAEYWLHRAIGSGDADVAAIVGQLLSAEGRNAEAETLLRSGAGSGSPRAMVLLGTLLLRRGGTAELDEAELWTRRGAEAGDIDGMALEAAALVQRGNKSEAETWARLAACGGNINAMTLLGLLLVERGENAEAEVWARRAARAGYVEGMRLLVVLLHQRGEVAEAETWARPAAAAGDTYAITSLAVLLRKRGETAEAEFWARYAADAGHPGAKVLLTILHTEPDEKVELELWTCYAKAAGGVHANGLLKAMQNSYAVGSND